ncbi:MAG: tyrosine-type recombinase/integrase [Chloroflexota bacterium]|nr:tyrosine-type recombinase/integrase [Chloroflexota bacterium]
MRERIDDYLNYLLEEEDYSENTVAAYRNDLGQFVQWLEDEGRATGNWDTVREEDIEGFLFYLREREYAPATVARKVAAVKSFCKHLVEQEELLDNPTSHVSTPKVDKGAPAALSRESIKRLLEAPTRVKSSKGIRDRAMLELLYGAGLRVSELVNLMVDDLDLENWTVRCGSGQNERVVPISPGAVSALSVYLNEDGGRRQLVRIEEERTLFLNMRGSQLTRQGLWLIIKHYVESAGIREDVTPHTLRHSFAIHHLRESPGTPEEKLAELQELLGHANISTTQVYAQGVS